MKDFFEEPELCIVRLTEEDVIVTSFPCDNVMPCNPDTCGKDI